MVEHSNERTLARNLSVTAITNDQDRVSARFANDYTTLCGQARKTYLIELTLGCFPSLRDSSCFSSRILHVLSMIFTSRTRYPLDFT